MILDEKDSILYDIRDNQNIINQNISDMRVEIAVMKVNIDSLKSVQDKVNEHDDLIKKGKGVISTLTAATVITALIELKDKVFH
jgi:hypothetical protein